MTGGFVKLHRCALDSWLWQMPAEQFKVALTVLVSANWRDGVTVSGGRRVDVPRGSLVTTLDDLAAKSGVTVRTCRTALKNLANLEFLTSTATNKFRVISVVNYDSYQAREDEPDKQSVTQLPGNCQASDKQLPGKRQTHYKEEEREEEKEGEEQEEEHTAPAAAGCVRVQPSLFAESAQEPREGGGVGRDTGPDDNAAPASPGGLTKAAVMAELLHGTEAERQARSEAADQEQRQGQWGRELQRRRKTVGITADELAKYLSVGGRRITAWEKGTAGPGLEEQQQCEERLAQIEGRIGELAQAATDELNQARAALHRARGQEVGRGFQATSAHARSAGVNAWRVGWDPERMRAAVRLVCMGLARHEDGFYLRPATVFQAKKLRDAAEQLDAGAVPNNGRQPLKGSALLDEMGAAADEMRRMGYGR